MATQIERNLTLSIAGAFVGSAVATLLAPYSGRRMHRLARRKIEDGSERLTEAASGLRQTRNDLLDNGAKVVKGANKVLG